MFYHKKKYNNYALMLAVFLLFLLPFSVAAESVLVIYPDIREPYLSVFREIVSGIDSSVAKVKEYRLKKDMPDEKLQSFVEKKKVTTVIALGKRGLKYARNLPDNISIVIGAILLPPDNIKNGVSGITLSPSPDRLFLQLRQFSNRVKTITVVYNEKNNAWLIEYAKQAAKTHGFNLRALPAKNLAEAANLYRDIVQQPLDNTHALWLLEDRLTVDSKTMLPDILNKAWTKKFLVFSSNPAYVKRGILFSLFPDNKAMGESLGLLVNRSHQQASIKSDAILPLTDLKIAVNLRAAEHLGLVFEKSQKRNFDLMFPPPN